MRTCESIKSNIPVNISGHRTAHNKPMHAEPATLRNFCGIAARSLPQKLLHCAGPVIGALTRKSEFVAMKILFDRKDSNEYASFSIMYSSELGLLKNIQYLVLECLFAQQILQIMSGTLPISETERKSGDRRLSEIKGTDAGPNQRGQCN